MPDDRKAAAATLREIACEPGMGCMICSADAAAHDNRGRDHPYISYLAIVSFADHLDPPDSLERVLKDAKALVVWEVPRRYAAGIHEFHSRVLTRMYDAAEVDALVARLAALRAGPPMEGRDA